MQEKQPMIIIITHRIENESPHPKKRNVCSERIQLCLQRNYLDQA